MLLLLLQLSMEKLVLPSLEIGEVDVWARMQYTEPAVAAVSIGVMLVLRLAAGDVMVVAAAVGGEAGIGPLETEEVAGVEKKAPGGTVWQRAGTVVGETGSSSLISSTGSSRNRGDGGGASVCRRRCLSAVDDRRLTTAGTTLVEMLRLTSELRRCFLKGLSLASCSLPETLPETDKAEFFRDLGALSRRSKHCLVGDGVNAGPDSGTGTRWKASCELISRTIASCSVSNVGWGLRASVDLYACLNMSMISATLWFDDPIGETPDVGEGEHRGLFITSAMLGLYFVSFLLLGVGGCIARGDGLAGLLPAVATCVLIERLRVFFRAGAGQGGFDGGFEGLALARDEDALRAGGDVGEGTGGDTGASVVVAFRLSCFPAFPVWPGRVGLSGRGELFHV